MLPNSRSSIEYAKTSLLQARLMSKTAERDCWRTLSNIEPQSKKFVSR